MTLLEQEGFLKRVHGGAALENADDISTIKKATYRACRPAFVKEGEPILIESGSTNAIFVIELGKR